MTRRSIFDGSGYYHASGPNGQIEDDFLACKHCQQGMLRKAWKLSGGFCTICDAPICTNCHGRTAKFGCEGPAIKHLERQINDHYRREQNAKVLGIN